MKHILVIRTDRMGDVILSTPVLSALKQKYPHAEITMLVAPYAVDVVSGHPDLDHVLTDDATGKHAGYTGLFKLAGELRSQHFDAALVLHPSFRLALLCNLAGIPIRIGTGYRAYSLLFNRKVYQHRKKSGRHELELNLDLAKELGATLDKTEFKFHIPDNAAQRISGWLHNNNLTAHSYIVLHPGSGGSAMDWPIDYFGELAKKLIETHNIKVVVTGTPAEKQLADQIANTAPGVVRADGLFSIKELAALLKNASVVVANSTGPLHLAVAVGARVTGLFCTLPACHPDRWGPYSSTANVLTPPPDTDYDSDDNPMRLVPVESVLNNIIKKNPA